MVSALYAACNILLFILYFNNLVNGECSRSISRTVRNIFSEEILSHFAELEISLPASCPLGLQHDVYGVQESHKFTDSPSRWVCGFCGKSFYDERFLDKHFDSRHEDKIIKGEHKVCLADYCDIFRCDVVTGRIKPHFWDMALCKESHMAKLMSKCQQVTALCVPHEVNDTQQTIIHGHFNESLCAYLTCERFWETSDNEVPRRKTVLYIVASVMIMFALFVYYFVAYTHFYTDESLLNGSRRRRSRQESAYRRINHEHIRQRIGVNRDF